MAEEIAGSTGQKVKCPGDLSGGTGGQPVDDGPERAVAMFGDKGGIHPEDSWGTGGKASGSMVVASQHVVQ